MIHPSQLTKEAGFEEGVVVEIRCQEVESYGDFYHGFFQKVQDCSIWYETEGGEILSAIEIDHIVSIRPLTGPMAIWNHAPEWAAVLLTSGQGLYRFFTSEEWSKWSSMMFDGEHDTITYRPFWAVAKDST